MLLERVPVGSRQLYGIGHGQTTVFTGQLEQFRRKLPLVASFKGFEFQIGKKLLDVMIKVSVLSIPISTSKYTQNGPVDLGCLNSLSVI